MKKIYGAAGLMLAVWANAAAASQSQDVEIRTLSNRADLISSGDALVEVRLPKNLKPQKLELRLNGRDVTSQFTYDAAGRRLVGLLKGLVEGRNELVADANGHGHGRPDATLTITNHSRAAARCSPAFRCNPGSAPPRTATRCWSAFRARTCRP